MKQAFLLIIVFALLSITCLSQINSPNKTAPVLRAFGEVSDEIKYYLNEAAYSKMDYDISYPDKEQISRLRLLAKEHKDLFLTVAKSELETASVDKTKHLVGVLILAETEDNHLLLALFTPQSIKTTFSQNSYAITFTLNDYIKFGYNGPASVYVIETLAAIKYYSAVPSITGMLNASGNPNLEKTMKALIDLNASNEIAEFVQTKILEELCAKYYSGTAYGVALSKVLKTVRTLSEDSSPFYSEKFRRINQQLIFEPDERTLIKFANQAKNERLRGTGILLLGAYKSQTGLKAIIEHLKTDQSIPVRSWAAQCLARYTNTDEEAVAALIDAYHTDKQHDVRWASIESLGFIGGQKAEAVIREAVNDKSPLIKASAQRIIEWIEKRQQ